MRERCQALEYACATQISRDNSSGKLAACLASSLRRWYALNDQLCSLEEELEIVERWTYTCPEYKNGLKILSERKYRLALDKLERLVVQRLFELTKLGMSGTGE